MGEGKSQHQTVVFDISKTSALLRITVVLTLSARRTRIRELDLREWRTWCSKEVRLLLEGRDLVKLG